MSKKSNNAKEKEVEVKTSNSKHSTKSSKGGKTKKGSKPNKFKPKNSDDITETDNVVATASGSINDSSFYYEDATVAEQIQSYSFNQFASVESTLGLSTGNEEWKFLLPNCMSIRLNPCIPITNNLTGQDGVTTSALQNFLWLVYGNARSAIYGPQDVLMAELAVGNMISTRTWLMRAMCVPFCIDFRNRAYPDELLKAMHIDADDMREHLAQYRIRFNTLTALANKIPFPASIQYFKKASKMYENVYVDDEKSVLAQSYMFNPATIWVLNEAYDSDGSGLETKDFVETGVIKNFSAYLDLWELQISALLNSSTMNYVYADILRLAQKGLVKEMLFFDTLPELTSFSPVYNTEIQLWVHNMMIVGMPQKTPDGASKTKYNDIKSDAGNNSVIYDPEWVDGYASNPGYRETPTSRILDFYTDNPGIEDKVAATRLSASWSIVSPAIGGKYYKISLAILDYYVVDAEIYSNSTAAPLTLDGNFKGAGYSVDEIAALSHFRWNPFIFQKKGGTYDGVSRLQCISGELNYYTVIDSSILVRMYDYEIIKELSIGDVSKG